MISMRKLAHNPVKTRVKCFTVIHAVLTKHVACGIDRRTDRKSRQHILHYAYIHRVLIKGRAYVQGTGVDKSL